MASPAKQLEGPHQPQSLNTTTTAAVPIGDNVAHPSTPARPTSASLRRSTRGSEQQIEVLTLPGTRWDKLDIERQRDQQGGREQHSNLTGTHSFNHLSLHEKRPQISVHQRESLGAIQKSEVINGRNQDQLPPQPPGHHALGTLERVSNRSLATESLSAGRRRANRSLPPNQRGLSRRGGRSFSLDAGPSALSPSLSTAYLKTEVSRTPRPIMARRPGRNQVDHFAELKETIHESLSKLSEIQEKLAPLGQQIVALEEELKAKESDSSKILPIRVFPNLDHIAIC